MCLAGFAAFGLEMFVFVPIGAVAGASCSAAALIQASTRSCFYGGFAAQRSFTEVIAQRSYVGFLN